MGNVYVDLDLTGSGNTGANWANAYEGSAGLATACSSASAGDDVWLQGHTGGAVTSGDLNLSCSAGAFNNPIRVHGVADGTSAEPPTATDLIQGLRAGDASEAWNNTPPIVRCTGGGTGDDLIIGGFVYFYGIKFLADADVRLNSYSGGSRTELKFDECEFDCGNGHFSYIELYIETLDKLICNDCKFKFSYNNVSSYFLAYCSGGAEFYRCVTDFTATPTYLIGGGSYGNTYWNGCDFAECATNLLPDDLKGIHIFENCRTHASVTLKNGTYDGPTRHELYNCGPDPGTPKGSGGSFQQLDVLTEKGDVTEETTIVRTAGANDGADGGFSWALTPHANGTRENYWSLVSPWMNVWIDGDGTSKTVTVYINNSGSADYNDDDVYMEIMHASEDGNIRNYRTHTQMELLGTPSAIADGTNGDWGGTETQAQELSASIAPDFSGMCKVRVHFAKHFASSPETLYVCPLPEVT